MNYMLITGAASGIGAATARRFAREGWLLGLLDVNAEALQQLNKSLGGQHWHQALDVRDEAAVEAAIQAFGAFSHGRLDLLLNSAGILRVGQFEDIPLAEHRLLMDINVTGLLQVCHKAFPLLRVTRNARVINMSSASALYGTPHFASYSASKFAVRGLTEALNIEWARHGITVQDIMPPFVKTPMVDSQTFKAPVIERLGVNLTPEDIADAIWQAAQGRQVHNPVSLQFKSLVAASKVFPARATRKLMDLLSR
ncbi:MAG: SDR family oxidoreductase [Marinobacter sp.]|nr:SDR family oxidoreductase [Marinobacter sp.]